MPLKNIFNKNSIEKIIRKGGQINRSPFFVCKYMSSKLNYSQFCIIVSSKVSKSAVQRNTIKRRIREAIRHNIHLLTEHYCIVLLVKPEILGASYQKIETEIKNLFSS